MGMVTVELWSIRARPWKWQRDFSSYLLCVTWVVFQVKINIPLLTLLQQVPMFPEQTRVLNSLTGCQCYIDVESLFGVGETEDLAPSDIYVYYTTSLKIGNSPTLAPTEILQYLSIVSCKGKDCLLYFYSTQRNGAPILTAVFGWYHAIKYFIRITITTTIIWSNRPFPLCDTLPGNQTLQFKCFLDFPSFKSCLIVE